ncbi:MAG: DUF1616 domain-containing protein [Candidatus Bathyarchaeia archaeon]
MKLKDYKLVFVAVGLAGVLLIASPALGAVLRFPGGEQFSELYLLGPGHAAEGYPFNILVGKSYSVYVGVGNHLGSSAYYTLYVKLRNQTDALPNATSGTPCPLQPLYEYKFALQDSAYWESLLSFSVSSGYVAGNQSSVNQLTINGVKFDVNKPSAWDSNSSRFSYQLIFELWLYDQSSDAVQFNMRLVDLKLNLIRTI